VDKSAADILLGNDEAAVLFKDTSIPDLNIIPSSPEMAAASRVLSTRPQYETVLRRSILQKNLPHKFVIIDCPPAVAAITTASLTAADLAIIPTQCEYFAIQAVKTIFGYIRRVREQHNPQLSFKLLVTMFDLRGKLHSQLYEKLASYYGNALFETVIGFDSKLRASQIAGQPITVFAPRTRATRQYRELAKEIEAYVQA
jgi:chromosome partitioning protein